MIVYALSYAILKRKKTALIHIFKEINVEKSLPNVLKKLNGEINCTLEVKLIGGRLSDNTSMENIKKVIEFLLNKNINILSAQILDSNQPTCVVVNPEDFTTSHKVPEIGLLDVHTSDANRFCDTLHTSFDFTQSKEKNPPNIAIELLNGYYLKFIHMDEENFKRCQSDYSSLEPFDHPILLHIPTRHFEVIKLLKECRKSLFDIQTQLDAIGINKTKIEIIDQIKELMKNEESKFYIGERSEEFNRPFVEKLKKNYARDEQVKYRNIAIRSDIVSIISISGIIAVAIKFHQLRNTIGIVGTSILLAFCSLVAVVAFGCGIYNGYYSTKLEESSVIQAYSESPIYAKT